MAGLRRLHGFGAMTLVALVVAHNLVFLLTYGAGYDEALAHSGHDGSWGTAVGVVLGAGIALLLLASWRLYRLGLIARATLPPAGTYAPSAGDFGRRLVELWWRLTAATTLLFVAQENLEHQRAGEALPGLAVLGSAEYRDAALVIAGVALVVALVGALFRWRRDVLIARIATALRRLRLRPESAVRRPAATRDRRPESPVGLGLGVRAPPLSAQ
jgi:hypothetical protein